MHARPMYTTVSRNTPVVLGCQLEARRVPALGNHGFEHGEIDRRRVATASWHRRYAASRPEELDPALQRPDRDAESLGYNRVGLAATLVCTNCSFAKLDRVGCRHPRPLIMSSPSIQASSGFRARLPCPTRCRTARAS